MYTSRTRCGILRFFKTKRDILPLLFAADVPFAKHSACAFFQNIKYKNPELPNRPSSSIAANMKI